MTPVINLTDMKARRRVLERERDIRSVTDELAAYVSPEWVLLTWSGEGFAQVLASHPAPKTAAPIANLASAAQRDPALAAEGVIVRDESGDLWMGVSSPFQARWILAFRCPSGRGPTGRELAWLRRGDPTAGAPLAKLGALDWILRDLPVRPLHQESPDA